VGKLSFNEPQCVLLGDAHILHIATGGCIYCTRVTSGWV